jgi:hypothetical protein
MNHLLRVILVLSLAIVAVAALIISNNRANPRPAHQLAVEQYVAYRQAMNAPTLTIRQYVAARLPQNFHPEMSKQSFGYSIYYETGQKYQSRQAAVDVWPVTIAARPVAMTATTILTVTYSGKPIPYPPNDLWCAQLSSPDPAATPTVVLAALHQDMYNAEWIVHEVTDPATVLPAIGCQFSAQ